jgi:DNA-binding SARP family transcriptional activator
LLHRLRRALTHADAFLVAVAQTVQWRPGAPFTLDVANFEAALGRRRGADRTGDLLPGREAMEEAITLYRGDLLPSCYDDWILPERERLRQRYLSALERLGRLFEAGREYDAAIGYARRLLRHDPLHEAAHRRLMRLHALKGDRAGAMRAYHTCATTLQRELGVEPSPTTRRAYEQLVQVELPPPPAKRMMGAVPPLVVRAEEWARLQERWRAAVTRGPRFTLLLGEAGIGKTQLVEEWLEWAGRQWIERAFARRYAAEGELAYAPVTALLRAGPLPPLDDVWPSEVAGLQRLDDGRHWSRSRPLESR